MLAPLSIVKPMQAQAQEADLSPHQRQAKAPHVRLELEVEEGVSKIVQASTQDLNVIYTPFKRAKITTNSNEQFTIDNDQIFFQLTKNKPFSLYVTEDGDRNAPKYKILLVPTDLPIGQQIHLVPTVPYFAKTEQEKSDKQSHSYQQSVISSISATAKYLATKQAKYLPDDFRVDDDFISQPYYIGNVLMSADMLLRSADFELFVLSANNRANSTLRLTAPDFAKMTPTTGLVEDASMDEEAVGVGFYPRKVIQPGQSTQIILIRPISRQE